MEMFDIVGLPNNTFRPFDRMVGWEAWGWRVGYSLTRAAQMAKHSSLIRDEVEDGSRLATHEALLIPPAVPSCPTCSTAASHGMTGSSVKADPPIYGHVQCGYTIKQ